MINNPRRMWTSIIFACLIAPFVVVLVLSVLPRGVKLAGGAGATSGTTAAVAGGGSIDGAGSASGGGGPASAASKTAPEHSTETVLQVAGDGHVVWVARPWIDENKTPGFELYLRSANTGIWHAPSSAGMQNFFPKLGFPRGMALSLPAGVTAGSEPVVFGDGGKAYELSLNNADTPLKRLPPEDLIKAVAGGEDQLFALTFGPAHALHSGDSVPEDQPAPLVAPVAQPSSLPATASATVSTTTATGPAPATAKAAVPVASSEPAASRAAAISPPEIFNVYWYPPVSHSTTSSASAPAEEAPPEPGTWSFRTPLGRPAGDISRSPSPSSSLALVESRGRLLVIWADPTRPRSLFVRSLDYAAKNAQWSDPPAETLLSDTDQVPAGSRLFAVTLDQAVYVLWTTPTGGTIALHGGWLNTDPAAVPESRYKLNGKLLQMSLDTAGQGATAGEIGVGASENSFVVVVSHESTLKSMVFDHAGVRIADAAPIVPEAPRHDVQIGQNIAMILIVLMLTLSLWQWRQKPPAMPLPAALVIAPMHLRALAFLVDLVIPYVLVFFLLGADAGPVGMLSNWLSLPSHPEDFARAWDLYAFLGIYLLHVTLGEMFFRKSLGKMLLGLEVRMLDGKPPTVGAVLTRNLIRIPETAVGLAVLYLVISDRKQRLGDLMAKTVVVAQEAPETPDDPDKK